MPVNTERRTNGFDQAAGNRFGLLPVCQPRQNNGELVTTAACQRILITQNPPQAHRNGTQQIIARLVAQGIIDVFKVIQIQPHRGRFAARIAIFPQRLSQALVEQDAVRQTGEIIVMSHMMNLCICRPLVGDIIGNQQHIVMMLIVTPDDRGAGVNNPLAARRHQQPLIALHSLSALRGIGELHKVFAHFGSHALRPALADKIALRPAEQLFGFVVDQQDLA